MCEPVIAIFTRLAGMKTDCPDANAILTYSQSTDPASPHYADATELYSNSGWIDMPFCEADRDEQEIRRLTVEE